MKIATVKEFRDHTSKLLASDEPVFITRNGKTAGVYIPVDADVMPVELRTELLSHLGEKNRRLLEEKGLTEEKILADFEASRKTRR